MQANALPQPLLALSHLYSGFGTSAGDKPYMVRVQETTAGVLHDHLALFKVSHLGGRVIRV